MKKLFAISCAALLALILVLSVTVSVAFADVTDGGDTSWSVTLPASDTITQEVSEEGLSDYAVTYYTDPENPSVSYYKYAFADNDKITVYSCYDTESGQIYMTETDNGCGREYTGGTIETTPLSGIVQTEFAEGGDLYCRDIFSNLYVIRSGSTVYENVDSDGFAFSDYDDFLGMVSDGENLYRIDDDGKLNVLNIATWETAVYPPCGEETYKNLKRIGSTVYVLGNALYTAEGGVIHPVSFSYEDYDTELVICTGNTFSLLQEITDGIYYADTDEDALFIPVDLNESGETFKIPSRIRRFSDVKKDADAGYPQVLLASEYTVLIYYGGQTYLTYGENAVVRSLSLTSPANDTYYALDDAGLYSMPYPSDSTRTGTVSKSSEVTAKGVAENPDISLFGTFYMVEYTDGDGETLTGYVLAAMLSEYDFDDDNPELISAEPVEASYDNNVTLCVIIMVLAAVLLVAAIYLTLVLTSAKRKK